MKSHKSSRAARLPRPKNADESLPSGTLERLSGWYRNPGYEEFEFCLYLPGSEELQNDTSSETCKALIDSLPTFLPGVLESSASASNSDVGEGGPAPALIAKWDRAWSTHLVLRHWNESMFNLTMYESREIIPITDSPGQNQSKFWAAAVHEANIITAQFGFRVSTDAMGLEEVASGLRNTYSHDRFPVGFGIRGGFWGAGEGVSDPNHGDGDEDEWETIRDRAEVWFEKVV
ncbi:hypothetical protein BT96DRAFT_571222 [Gymnopus androsaceus JB14]|uniref:Uncharacterized protein n=1 Tax=Gymnopus androsaceus JB14 TaxID=1447944 RepID=A0A6A4HZ88_9AGAR|nr:hypothetical protein BT96DRAFT_571222 [Gymnopus androsaceus JB14]